MRADTGKVRQKAEGRRIDMERDMSAVMMMVKGALLIAMTLTAFSVLAWTLGYEPAAAESVTRCDAAPKPICLFTII